MTPPKPSKKTIHDWQFITYLDRFCVTGICEGVRITREVFWKSHGYVGTASADPLLQHQYRLGYAGSDEPQWLAHPKWVKKAKYRREK